MPPGQFYARYAGPLTYEEVNAFLRYDTMHLSEWSLFLDSCHGKTYSGQEREGIFATLRRMAAALPYMPLSKLPCALSPLNLNNFPTSRDLPSPDGGPGFDDPRPSFLHLAAV
jgi:hypothetical protein